MRRTKRPSKARVPSITAPIFAALGDETRLHLIGALCAGGAMSISELTAGTDHTRQAITKHLDVLGAAGLVRDARIGREHLWEFDPTPLRKALHSLELIAAQWESLLQKLNGEVEQ